MKTILTISLPILFSIASFSASSSSSAAGAPAKITVHFFGQSHANSFWGDLILGYYEQGLDKLDAEDLARYHQLREEHQSTLASQRAIFAALRSMIENKPHLPVYVEGLTYSARPIVFGGALEERVREAFAEGATEAQEVYLMTLGAAHVLHSLGVIPSLCGTQDDRFTSTDSAMYNFAYLDSDKPDTVVPRGLGLWKKSPTTDRLQDKIDLIAGANRYICRARESFLIETIKRDAVERNFDEVVIVFGRDHTKRLKIFFNHDDFDFIDELEILSEADGDKDAERATCPSTEQIESRHSFFVRRKLAREGLIEAKEYFHDMFQRTKSSFEFLRENSLGGKESDYLLSEIGHVEFIMHAAHAASSFKDKMRLAHRLKDLQIEFFTAKAIEDSADAETFTLTMLDHFVPEHEVLLRQR